MARADLRSLVANLGATEPTPSEVPTPKSAANSEGDTALAEPIEPTTKSPRRRQRRPQVPDPTAAAVHYSDYQRKETRLRTDQQNALTENARRLNREKGSGGPRITDNTLIRVAVDLLLERSDRLAGSDEKELGRSVGLKAGQS
jgi:hypothetical protein